MSRLSLGSGMRRREFLGVLGGAAALPVVARAQPVERIRRIGVLMNQSADDSESKMRAAAFLEVLQQRGWQDGCGIGRALTGRHFSLRCYKLDGAPSKSRYSAGLRSRTRSGRRR